MRVLASLCCGAALFSSPVFAEPALPKAGPEWYLRPQADCRIFVQEYGAGRHPVVVLHGGWGAEHSYLLDAFNGVAGDYRIVFYDQRGSLRSACRGDPEVSVQDHVDDLERLRATLGTEKITLFGHSMGTTLAMAYLQQHPEKVRGMVLVSTSIPRPPREQEKAIWTRQEEAKTAFLNRPEIAAELARLRLNRPSAELSDKERSYAWRIRFAGGSIYDVGKWTDVKGGIAYWNGEVAETTRKTFPKEYDFTPALARHPCPIEIIQGDHDYGPLTTQAYAQTWIRDLPKARLTVIPKAGHNVWIDQPADFRKALQTALKTTTTCRS